VTLTGFTDLDKLTGGFSEGELVFLASRPYVGKTALALSIAANVIRREPEPTLKVGDFSVRDVRRGVAVFSLQSSKEQVVERMVSLVGHLPVGVLRSGTVNVTEWPKLVRSVAEVSRAPLFVNDSIEISLREMRVALEGARRGLLGTDVDLGFVIVDHIHLMLPRSGSWAERKEHTESVLRGLKHLARDIDVPVMVIANVGPETDQRHDKRPWLSDFGETLPVDQFADTVIFLYRDEFYDPNSDDKGIAEVIVAKQRNGPTGKIQLAFLEKYQRFASLARA